MTWVEPELAQLPPYYISFGHLFTGLTRHRPVLSACMSSQGSQIPITDNSTLSSGWPKRASKVRPLSAIFDL